jgi:hypothetical protein
VAGCGARWEGVLGNQRRWPTQCFDGSLRRTVAPRPTCRGKEAHEGGAGWSALGAKKCGDEGAEERGESRVEWRRLVAVMGRGETTSPTDRQHDGVTHETAAACVARGADVAAGRQRQRVVATVAVQLSCTRDSNVQAPLKQRLRLTSGPWQFFYLIRFSNTYNLIFENVIFLMSKFCKFFIGIAGCTRNDFPFRLNFKFPKN